MNVSAVFANRSRFTSMFLRRRLRGRRFRPLLPALAVAVLSIALYRILSPHPPRSLVLRSPLGTVSAPVAGTPATRQAGLRGRPGRSLFFWWPRSGRYGFTMRGVRQPLVLFGIRSGRIVSRAYLRPFACCWRTARVRLALEVPAGSSVAAMRVGEAVAVRASR